MLYVGQKQVFYLMYLQSLKIRRATTTGSYIKKFSTFVSNKEFINMTKVGLYICAFVLVTICLNLSEEASLDCCEYGKQDCCSRLPEVDNDGAHGTNRLDDDKEIKGEKIEGVLQA